MNELLKEIGKLAAIGIGVAFAATAAYAFFLWLYHKLKSCAQKWWEDNKRRFRNGENVKIYINLRDLSNQLKRGKEMIHLMLTGEHSYNTGAKSKREEVTLPPIDIQTDVECSRENAEKIRDEQTQKRKPICVMCAV